MCTDLGLEYPCVDLLNEITKLAFKPVFSLMVLLCVGRVKPKGYFGYLIIFLHLLTEKKKKNLLAGSFYDTIFSIQFSTTEFWFNFFMEKRLLFFFIYFMLVINVRRS
ncbi:hypothetical protein Hanom_Chr08g00717611 [Helianthus anomalus]